MAFLMLCFTSLLLLPIAAPSAIDDASTTSTQEQEPEQFVPENNAYGCSHTGNPVDDCWRCDPNWANNRQRLADCAVGFGRYATGGKGGKTYVVTDPSDNVNQFHPTPGTLRYALAQKEPLWITFAHDMTIQPKHSLLVASRKTVDGRGANVIVGNGGTCFVVKNVSNVIIHGISIRYCKPVQGAAAGSDDKADHSDEGDAVSVFGSRNVWVDHCTLESCADGLLDVTGSSTNVTLSNNILRNHNKTMLLGHSDYYSDDKNMKVTVAYNRFGPGLVQRQPRCRFGLFHVINNDYIQWKMYAIGGSASPRILSHGNRFLADKAKEVTKREVAPKSVWSKWTWISENDAMLNGAFFQASGTPTFELKAPNFAKAASSVAAITASAGALSCKKGSPC